MNKFSKKELIGAIKNMKPKETNIVRQNGKIEVIAKGDEIEVSSSKEITLKSIYEFMTTKFESIDNRFDSIDNEIKAVKADVYSVKQDVKNLDNKVIALDAKVTNLDSTVQNLGTKLNKVIELNKDIITLNKIKVSKENKIWLFANGHDDNTPPR